MKNLAGLVLGCGCLAGAAFADPAPEPRPLSASQVDRVVVGAVATVTHAERGQSLTAAQMDAVTAGNPAVLPLTSLRLPLVSFAPLGCLLGCDLQSGSSSSSSAQDGAGYVPPQFPGTTPTPTPPQFP
jgi:hypothetical protein